MGQQPQYAKSSKSPFMPRLRYSDEARDDLMRLAEFWREKSPNVAVEALNAILLTIDTLTLNPLIGRPYMIADYGFRELVIAFGKGGYLALYVYDEQADSVDVLAIRHQRELKYNDF